MKSSVNLPSLFFSLTCGLLAFTTVAGAAMTGASYKIDSDSINSGGIDESVSASYDLMDTVGEVATGESGSENYNVAAGYRQMEESSVTIGASAQDVVMAPALVGMTGGTSTGLTNITVVTDSSAGYALSIVAADSPALRSPTDTFADYVPVGAVPDFNLVVNLGQSIFAFAPEGPDVVSRYLNDGSSCGAVGGSSTASRCWDGLATTSRIIAASSFGNVPAGVTTIVRFAGGIGVGRHQDMGDYTATTTVTAVAL
jgi:hypothetical protein